MWTQQPLKIPIPHVLILLSLVIVIILPYQPNYLHFLESLTKIMIFIYVNNYFNYYTTIIIDSISFRCSILLILCPKIFVYIVILIHYFISIHNISIIVQLNNIPKIYSLFTCHKYQIEFRNGQKHLKIIIFIFISSFYIHPSSGNCILLFTVDHLYVYIYTCISLYNYDYE